MENESARDRVIARIQKLMAIANSTPNQAEAETALAKAQAIMVEHNVSQLQVETTVVGRDSWTRENAWTGTRRPVESPFVGRLVLRFFFVRVLIGYEFSTGERRRCVQFFGAAENVAMARYVYVFLCRTFRDLWRTHKRAHRLPQREARSFYAGLELGLHRKLRMEREQLERDTPNAENALTIVSSRLEMAFESEYGGIRKLKDRPVSVSNESYLAGFQEGQQIDIRKPIGGETAKRIDAGS